MPKNAPLFALLVLVVSLAVIAACSQEPMAPVDDSRANFAQDAGEPAQVADLGPFTPGFWKTHAAAWPVGQLTIGGTGYSKDACLAMLSQPMRGDHAAILCRQLIATKLNLITGCEGSCVVAEVAAADVFLAQISQARTVGEFVPMSTRGRPLSEVLDDYNNGLLCAEAPVDD